MFNGHLKYEPINSLLFNFTVIFNKFPKKTDNPYSKIGIIRFYTCNLKFYHKGTSFVKTYFYTGGGKLPLPCSRLRSAASCRSHFRDRVRLRSLCFSNQNIRRSRFSLPHTPCVVLSEGFCKKRQLHFE